MARSNRTRHGGFKPKEGSFRVGVRKKFFSIRVVRPWKRLPREAVGGSSQERPQARLDAALNNLVQCKITLLVSGDWN